MPDEEAKIDIDVSEAGRQTVFDTPQSSTGGIQYPDPPDFDAIGFNNALRQFAKGGIAKISGKTQAAFDDLVQSQTAIAKASFYAEGASIASQHAAMYGGNIMPVPPTGNTTGAYSYSDLGFDAVGVDAQRAGFWRGQFSGGYGYTWSSESPYSVDMGETGLVPHAIPWQSRKFGKGPYDAGPTIDADFRSDYIDSTSGGWENEPYPYKSADYYKSLYSSVSRKSINENLADAFETRGGQWAQLTLAAAAAQGLEGAGRYYQTTQSGNYLTPEQQNTASASLGLGFAGVAGTVIGAAIGGPGGAVVGGIVGTGIGNAATSVVTADNERNQSLRLTSERLGGTFAGEMSDASASVRNFRDELENARTPIKMLADVVQTFQQNAFGIGPKSVNSIDAFASGLGTFAPQVATDITGFLRSSPITAPAAIGFSVDPSGYSTNQLAGFTALAAASGDPAFNSFREALSKRGADGSAAIDALQGKRPGSTPVLTWYSEPATGKGTPIQDVDTSWFLDQQQEFTNERATSALGETRATMGRASLGLQLLEGAQRPEVPEALTTGTRARIASLDQQIGGYRKMLDDRHITPGSTAYNAIQSQILGLETQKIGANADYQSGIQATTLYDLGTSEANFNLRFTAHTLAGESYDQMRPLVSSYENYLFRQARTARDLTPAQRAAMTEQGLDLGYENMIRSYSQNESALGVGIASGRFGVASAQAFGTPGSVQSAQSTEIERYRDLQKQIGDELDKNNLKRDDSITKEKQLVDLGSQIASLENQKQEQFYSSTQDMGGSRIGGYSALQPFRIAARGNVAGSGYDGRILSGDEGLYQNALTASKDPKLNAQQRAYWAGQADQDQAKIGSDLIDKYRFSPSARDATRYSNDVADFQVSQNTPYLDGPNSNPFSKGMAVIGDLEEQRRGAEASNAAIRKAVASGTWQGPEGSADEAIRQNQEKINQYRVQESELQRDRYTEMFKAVPELTEGSPGAGLGVAITPFAALSARFSPNPWMTGGFSHATMPSASLAPTPTAGGSEGGFTASLLQQAVTELKTLNSKVSGPSGGSPTPAVLGPLTNSQNAHYLSGYSR